MPDPQTATPDQTLPAMVRAKYPGVYDDLSDQELDTKVRAKFPGVYDDLQKPTTGSAEQTPKAAPAAPPNTSGQVFKDLGIGVMKGGGQTFVNLGHLIDKVPGVKSAIDALYGSPGLSDRAFAVAADTVKPSNTAQSIGAGAEHIAEAIIPGKAISGAGLSLAGRVAPAIQPYVGASIARVLPYAATEAAGGAGLSAAQGNDPITGAVAGGALAVAPTVARAAASNLMQSAVKPTLSLLAKYKTTAPKLVQTLLEEGVNVTPAGLGKIEALLGANSADIRAAVQGAGSVEPIAVASRLSPLAQKFAQQVSPTADLEAISDVGQDFLKSHAAPLSLADAQDIKTGTYQQVKKAYGKLSNANVEAQKTLARGLKEEIEKQAPGIGALNAENAKLAAAKEAIARRVALSGNRDPIGFAWVAQKPLTFLAALADRSPMVKSLVARGMYEAAGKAAKVDPQLIRTAVSSVAETVETAAALPTAQTGAAQ